MKKEIKQEQPKIKILGTFKFKDKVGRQSISFDVSDEVSGIIIEKVKCQTNKFIIGTKLK